MLFIIFPDVGESVIFSNTDAAAHTFTSGTPDHGGDGAFDTSLLMAGNSYEWIPETAGEQPYFCMVHPWMIGLIVVNGDTTEPIPIPEDTIRPKILKPADVVVDAENQNGAVVYYDILAIDNVDELVTASCNLSTGSFFSVGDTEVVCNARDSSGNRAIPISFYVTVNLPELVIPEWIKNIAQFWCENKLEDQSFIEGIQYLIDNDIIVIPVNPTTNSSSQDIPDWIKNNACWWSQGIISDEDFASGIQYLVSKGIIQV